MTPNNHKSKIVHLITQLETGGAEMMLFKVLSGMNREKYASEVISLVDVGSVGKKIQSLGIPVHGVGMQLGRPDPLSIWRLIQLVRKLKPGVIQGWMYHGNLAAQIVSTFLSHPVPVLWNIRHSLYDLAYEKWMTAWVIRLGAKLSRKPAQILYNSNVSAAQHEALGYAADKRVMIPNGFDTDVFSPSEEAKSSIRKELEIPSTSPLIGLIGRYHPMKDHAGFIRAAAHLSKSHEEVHFLLAGRNVDADNEELMGLINELNLSRNVHLLGKRDDVNRLMASLDIASSSSYFGEGFPNVIGEAMACGVPCVVTDVGDSGAVVGDTGQVVPPKDPVAMASAWKHILDLGPQGRKELGMKARERVVNNFTLKKIVSEYENLYSRFL
jgi:glycosyltransferase involved in cell wall biosynthesis